MQLAALRRCTTALMVTTLQTVSAKRSFCSNQQHFLLQRRRTQTAAMESKPESATKVSPHSRIHASNLRFNFFPVPQSEFPRSPNQFFDLTAARIPTIIMRTSLLWRADKPSELGNPGRGLHGWRQNIFLLPAVLFPHLERELQLPPSVVSSKVAVSKSLFRNVIRT
jgi:hypothetical protein